MILRLAFLSALAGIANEAAAQTVQLCPDRAERAGADGRVLGHFAYGEAAAADLVEAPSEFSDGRGCLVRREMLPDLERLVAAVRDDPQAQGRIVAVSCFRAIARQQAVFCAGLARDAQDGNSNADRAISVGPPGHSEHATGFVIDVGVRPANGCRDAEACMAAHPVARWMLEHARDYGFELSFPPGNAQNVKWEPWHWRWVGATAQTSGAAKARFVFARARAAFPADPGIVTPPRMVRTVFAPAPVAAPVVEKKGRKKRRR